ncbi:hypothetical protein L6164_033417 [Bauhinia variegata]|uniref:Uncharacterized protein n=1 Tax=Bauhinia variegata TaxID=167791 RepID=A0ACB9KS04_BAUVA|nr:hypothetical protein L6164_033417 [Bauhinia variegata]
MQTLQMRDGSVLRIVWVHWMEHTSNKVGRGLQLMVVCYMIKYYLVDTGYTNYEGFLAPYRGQRYHLNEWREGQLPTTPIVFRYMESKASSQGGKHVWLPKEDVALVECMAEMKIVNKYVSDNGFKPGFLQYLEMMGSHISGFGWDNKKSMVIADKVYKKAAPFRSKPFPHFDALCTVWAKDRAIGKAAQGADEVNEEETLRTRSRSRSRKKRKNDVVVDVLRDAIVTIQQSFQHATKKLCTKVHRLAHDVVMDERKEKLFEDLLKVQGLTPNEIYDAHMKLTQDSNLLIVFPTIPEPFKADWICRLI